MQKAIISVIHKSLSGSRKRKAIHEEKELKEELDMLKTPIDDLLAETMPLC
jgi:hypothetical protein